MGTGFKFTGDITCTFTEKASNTSNKIKENIIKVYTSYFGFVLCLILYTLLDRYYQTWTTYDELVQVYFKSNNQI